MNTSDYTPAGRVKEALNLAHDLATWEIQDEEDVKEYGSPVTPSNPEHTACLLADIAYFMSFSVALL